MAERELISLDESTPQLIAPQAGDTAILPITLNHASNNEVALTLDYTTNKAAGDDTGLVINQTDTASPGTSLLADFQVGGTSKFSVDNSGVVSGPADLVVQLGDNAGTNKLSVQDSDGNEVAQIDSDGGLSLWRQGYTDRGLILKHGSNFSTINSSVSGYGLEFQSGGTTLFTVDIANDANAVTVTGDGISGYRGAEFLIRGFANNNDTATTPTVLQGANAFASASTNQDGGNVNIKLGEHATGGGSAGLFQVLAPDDSVVITADEAGQLIVGADGTFGATTGLMFGDGDSGIYENNDDNLIVYLGGTASFQLINSAGAQYIRGSSGSFMRNVSPSATVVSVGPNIGDVNTGIGHAAADQLSLIAGGVEGIRISEDTTITIDMNGAVLMPDLPTSDPTNAGQLWSDSGTLKVSAG